MGETPIRYPDVVTARQRIAGHTVVTEVRAVDSLGFSVKLENTQITGSFKLRGATNVVRALRPGGVVAGSSGNHGVAMSYAAREAGIERAVIVMATDHSAHKRARIEGLGGEVIVGGAGNTGRDRLAQQIAVEDGLEYVSSYDHPLVIAGQGTIGLEIIEAEPDTEAIVAPHVRVIGVEPITANDTRLSLDAGRPVTIDPPDTICDGVRAQTPGTLTFPIVQRLVDDVITVSDDEVIEAMYLLWRQGLVIEASGALSVAGARRLGLGRGAVCVVSGGNVRPEVHGELIGPLAAGEP